MSPEFQWQTEDEGGYGATAIAVAEAAPIYSFKFWLLFLLAAVLLGLVGWAIWAQLRQQVDRIAENAEVELLASHRLVESAAVQGDMELLNLLLSGRDPAWTRGQYRVVEAGLFVDRTPFGLTTVPNSFGQSEVSIAPHLKAAEVVTTRPYQTNTGNGSTEIVQLKQTAVYRRTIDDQWLLSPPFTEFWDGRGEIRLRHLTVTYPNRDKEIAERLAIDLADVLGQMCRAIYNSTITTCQSDFQAVLNFDINPASLSVLAQTPPQLSPARQVSLPTPTLVGLPANEAAYQALLQGYAAQFLSPMTSLLLDWECCARSLFYLASLHWQLDKMGVKPWPLDDSDYATLLGQTPNIETLRNIWYLAPDQTVSEQELLAVYALVEFIFTHYGNDTPWIERQRGIPLTINFRDWLLLNHPVFLNTHEIESEWYAYMAGRTMLAQHSPPAPLPDEDLYVACYMTHLPVRVDGVIRPAVGELSLLRYSLSPHTVTSIYQEEVTAGATVVFNSLRPLHGQSGLQLDATITIAWQNSAHLWLSQNETMYALWPPAAEFRSGVEESLVGFDPTGQRLLLTTGEAASPQLLLRDDDCPVDTCSRISLPGWPFWSPGGDNMVILGDASPSTLANASLYWATGDGQNMAELGAVGRSSAHWVDEETAVILQYEPVPILYQLQQHDLTLQPLTAMTDLLAILPEPVIWDDSHRLEILADPAEPERWYILGSGGYWGIRQPSGRYLYIVTYDRSSGAFDLLYFADDSLMALRGAGISADGRYLSVVLQTSPLPMIGRGNRIQILDATNGRLVTELDSFTSGPLDGQAIWSSDGRWLVALQERILTLYNPDHDYHHLIGLSQPGCQITAWSD